MRALVILVNADRRALRHTEALLSDAGHLVAPMWSFVEAKKVLDSVIPDLLVADIRLEAYNGLHLAIRSRHEHPDVPVIVTHAHGDPVIEAQAEQYGAQFVAAPLENPAYFLRCVTLRARRAATNAGTHPPMVAQAGCRLGAGQCGRRAGADRGHELWWGEVGVQRFRQPAWHFRPHAAVDRSHPEGPSRLDGQLRGPRSVLVWSRASGNADTRLEVLRGYADVVWCYERRGVSSLTFRPRSRTPARGRTTTRQSCTAHSVRTACSGMCRCAARRTRGPLEQRPPDRPDRAP